MIIGISGKMHSGKDTLGKLIVKEAEDIWEIRKFGYKLKLIASILTGIPAEKFEDQEFKDSFLGPEWDQPKIVLDKDHGRLKEEKEPMQVRRFLQLLGTEASRFALHKDVWTNALFADYEKCIKCGEDENLHFNCEHGFTGKVIGILCNECGTLFNYPNWIITDVRFPLDVKAVRDRGGIVIRINRVGLIEGTHESEVALDNYEGFDAIYQNDGTIEELAEFAKKVLHNVNIQR